MSDADRIEAENLLLRGALESCVSAMNKAVRVGVVEHLDCCDDGGKWWHEAVEIGQAALKTAKERAP